MARTLNMLQSAQLINYIQQNYAQYNLHDEKFAKKASEELGFKCSFWAVHQRREMLGIPATAKVHAAKKISDTKAVEEYIAALEKRVTTLEFELAALKNRPYDSYKK